MIEKLEWKEQSHNRDYETYKKINEIIDWINSWQGPTQTIDMNKLMAVIKDAQHGFAPEVKPAVEKQGKDISTKTLFQPALCKCGHSIKAHTLKYPKCRYDKCKKFEVKNE